MTNFPDDTKVNRQPVQTNKKKKSKLIRILTIPIRLLTGVRDMYVKSMNNYADKAPYVGAAGGIGGGGVSQQPLPRSFSAASSTRSSTGSDDLAELIRAVSTRDYGDKIDLDSVFSPTPINNNTPTISRSGSVRNGAAAGAPTAVGGIGVSVSDKVSRASSTGRLMMKPPVVLSGGMKVPRSASVGMAKIDEDKVIEMFEDENRCEDDSKSKKKKKNKGKKKNDVEVRKESALFPRNRSYKYPGTATTTTTPVVAAATAAVL